MRRNRASLKKLEALLKDNKKQREELVNLYGKTIETQERLEEMASMLKMKEAEPTATAIAQQKRGIAYALGWTEERALALAVLIMYMLMMALGRKVCGW